MLMKRGENVPVSPLNYCFPLYLGQEEATGAQMCTGEGRVQTHV